MGFSPGPSADGTAPPLRTRRNRTGGHRRPSSSDPRGSDRNHWSSTWTQISKTGSSSALSSPWSCDLLVDMTSSRDPSPDQDASEPVTWRTSSWFGSVFRNKHLQNFRSVCWWLGTGLRRSSPFRFCSRPWCLDTLLSLIWRQKEEMELCVSVPHTTGLLLQQTIRTSQELVYGSAVVEESRDRAPQHQLCLSRTGFSRTFMSLRDSL